MFHFVNSGLVFTVGYTRRRRIDAIFTEAAAHSRDDESLSHGAVRCHSSLCFQRLQVDSIYLMHCMRSTVYTDVHNREFADGHEKIYGGLQPSAGGLYLRHKSEITP